MKALTSVRVGVLRGPSFSCKISVKDSCLRARISSRWTSRAVYFWQRLPSRIYDQRSKHGDSIGMEQENTTFGYCGFYVRNFQRQFQPFLTVGKCLVWTELFTNKSSLVSLDVFSRQENAAF